MKTFTVPPTSRFNVAVSGPGSTVPELANENFGVRIDSTQPIVVERSLYWNAGGVSVGGRHQRDRDAPAVSAARARAAHSGRTSRTS